MHPVEVAGLVKTFGSFRALDGLDLEVRAGEVHGFLGPNGSGKSTTIRVLLGMLRTDGGTVRVFGARIRGPMPPGCTTGWPTCRGTWCCGPA